MRFAKIVSTDRSHYDQWFQTMLDRGMVKFEQAPVLFDEQDSIQLRYYTQTDTGFSYEGVVSEGHYLILGDSGRLYQQNRDLFEDTTGGVLAFINKSIEATGTSSHYMTGLCNGLILAESLLTGGDPDYLTVDLPTQPEIDEPEPVPTESPLPNTEAGRDTLRSNLYEAFTGETE